MTRDFNNQWVEIFAAGQQTDSRGRTHEITTDYLGEVVRNYSASVHEAPAVVGHPEDNTPAYGWVSALRVNGDKLEAQFKDVAEEFESLVRDGRFKKRSASFYVDAGTAPGKRAPYLKHVGFLGAQPPAVKGLRDILFSEGESLTFESINFSEGTTMEDKDVEKVAGSLFDKFKAMFTGGKKDEAANFSESDLQTQIAAAVKAGVETATASFTEQLKERDTKIAELTNRFNSQATGSTRDRIIAFCDKQGMAKVPPAFRAMGIVEFMEVLAANDAKVTVISFAEEDGKKTEVKTETPLLGWFQNFVEKLPPFIQFGEHFGGLQATGGDSGVSPERQKELREKAGLPAKQGGE